VLALAPAVAQAGGRGADDGTPDPSAPPQPATSVAPSPQAPGAGQDTGAAPDGEPQEILEPAPQAGAKPTQAQQQQAQADAIAKQQAQEAAAAAVSEARVAYERALAKDRIAKFKVQQLLDQSGDAAHEAADLRRDMGNIARMAYSSGNSDFNLLAVLLDAESPEDVLARAEAAKRISSHKETQWYAAKDTQANADSLADEARRLADQSAKDLAVAKADLREAIALADAVDLAIEPPEKVPPVDLTTKSDWVFPSATGKIDSNAGMRMHPILHYMRCHAGADISAPSGTPIYAVDDGVVLSAGVNGGYGNFTLIAHGDGMTSGYAHQQTILVKPGDRVTRGQLIGEVGTTGLSTGPHLHFEASYHGVPYNPRGWLEDRPDLRVPAC
jgi:murein DD-endopeptidase MepM/ murein hydrolase activator NlpD